MVLTAFATVAIGEADQKEAKDLAPEVPQTISALGVKSSYNLTRICSNTFAPPMSSGQFSFVGLRKHRDGDKTRFTRSCPAVVPMSRMRALT